MKTFHLSLAAGLALAAVVVGCAPEADETPVTTDAPPALDPHAGHDHPPGEHPAHPTEGPHGGGLIELGDEEYHGELVHERSSSDGGAGTVTIYLLDDHADEAAPIDAAELTVVVTRDGNRESFKLAADPDAGDPAGKSSRFVSADAELAERLDREGGTARLMVRIAGRSYSGDVAHDHEGHDDH